jgi:hypothetical protein
MKASLYTILCIVVRLGAVLLFVQTLASFPFTWRAAQAAEPGPGAGGVVVAFDSLALVLAFALWLYPGLLARLAAGRASRQPFESHLDAGDWQAIGFAVLGVGLALGAVPRLFGEGLRTVLTARMQDIDTAPLLVSQAASIGEHLLQVVLGLLLALRARGLAGLLERLRDWAPAQPGATASPPPPE